MSLKSRLNQTHYSHADKKIKQSKKNLGAGGSGCAGGVALGEHWKFWIYQSWILYLMIAYPDFKVLPPPLQKKFSKPAKSIDFLLWNFDFCLTVNIGQI